MPETIFRQLRTPLPVPALGANLCEISSPDSGCLIDFSSYPFCRSFAAATTLTSSDAVQVRRPRQLCRFCNYRQRLLPSYINHTAVIMLNAMLCCTTQPSPCLEAPPPSAVQLLMRSRRFRSPWQFINYHNL